MRTTQLLSIAALLSAALAAPALARDGHRHPHHRHVAHGDVVAADPLDDFIVNGNQPYFDGTDGGAGYMGYYRRGFGPPPVLVSGEVPGCVPGARFTDRRRRPCR